MKPSTNISRAASDDYKKKPAQPTLKDIARHAGLSYSTVARTLSPSNQYPVSDQMRQQVLAAVRELKYTVNPFARYLSSQRSQIIGLCGPMNKSRRALWSQTDFNINRRIGGIIANPLSDAYNLMVIVRDDEMDDRQERMMQSTAYLDGLIFVSPTNRHKELIRRVSQRIPVVIDGAAFMKDISSVGVDQKQAVESSVQLLNRHGCRRLGLVLNQLFYHHNQVRLDAFRRMLRTLGLPFEESRVRFTIQTMESAYQATKTILSAQPWVDGLICGRDQELLGILRAVDEAGLRLGQDIRLISLNETDATREMSPGITAVCFPTEQIAHESFKLLLDQIEGVVTDPVHLLLCTSIVERESTLGAAR